MHMHASCTYNANTVTVKEPQYDIQFNLHEFMWYFVEKHGNEEVAHSISKHPCFA